ncbi:hypothetical protein AB1460_36515, partial [Parafrankia sp. FMc2]
MDGTTRDGFTVDGIAMDGIAADGRIVDGIAAATISMDGFTIREITVERILPHGTPGRDDDPVEIPVQASRARPWLSLLHISDPTRPRRLTYASV